jgi:hypothetical protein
MTTKSTAITNPCTLLEELVERSRLSWLQVALAVALLLIVLLLGTAYLEGLLARPLDADFWRANMMFVVITPYTLLVQPILRRLRDSAIKGFRPLVRISDADFQQLLAEAPIFNRRGEWLALGVGALGTLLLSLGAREYYLGPTLVYGVFGGGLMYCLLSWFIYSSLSGTRLFAQLQRRPLEVNVFDLEPLEPIGRWSLGIALGYIGGNALSLLFLTPLAVGARYLSNIIIYAPLIVAPAAVFFLNMMSTHRVMVEAKKRELKRVRVGLEAAYEALNERAAKGKIEDLRAPLDSFTAWASVEERVKEVPEWPYSESILRSLAGLVFLPIVVFVVEGMLLQVVLHLMSGT